MSPCELILGEVRFKTRIRAMLKDIMMVRVSLSVRVRFRLS